MKIHMTSDSIKALKPADVRLTYWDDALKGLGLEVMPAGARTWYFKYSRFGLPGRIKLGSYPAMTLDQAKVQVRGLKTSLDQGEDPRYIYGSTPGQRVTVQALAERYLAEYLPQLKPKTQAKYRGIVNHHIVPRLGPMLVTRVAETDIERVKAEMVTTQPSANNVLGVISSMFVWAESLGLRRKGSNPAQDVENYPSHPRQVYLTEAQYAQVAAAVETAEGPEAAKAALKLILLTGARKEEIAEARWSWIDLDNGLIRIPWEFHKTGETSGEKIIHLSLEAMMVLISLPRTSSYVCPNNQGGQNYEVDPLWRRVRATLGLEKVHIHDLRHSYASIAINNGYTLDDIRATLGHASVTTTRRYAHLMQSKARTTALGISGLVSTAMSPKVS